MIQIKFSMRPYIKGSTKESTSKCNLFANLSVMFEKDLIWIHEV